MKYLIPLILLAGCSSTPTVQELYNPDEHIYEHAQLTDKTLRLKAQFDENFDSIQVLKDRVEELEDQVWRMEQQ